MNSKIIAVRNLHKSFGEVRAVRDISFSVKQGEKFAFLGVNGAGKSTTIAMICGLLPKDKGEILAETSRKTLARLSGSLGLYSKIQC